MEGISKPWKLISHNYSRKETKLFATNIKMSDFIQKSVGRFFSNFLQCMHREKDNKRREKTELSDTFLARQKIQPDKQIFKPKFFRHTKKPMN